MLPSLPTPVRLTVTLGDGYNIVNNFRLNYCATIDLGLQSPKRIAVTLTRTALPHLRKQ
jgi:hypothetical protein